MSHVILYLYVGIPIMVVELVVVFLVLILRFRNITDEEREELAKNLGLISKK